MGLAFDCVCLSCVRAFGIRLDVMSYPYGLREEVIRGCVKREEEVCETRNECGAYVWACCVHASVCMCGYGVVWV